jgi:hypothetical protein
MPDEDLIQAEWEKHGKFIQLFVLFNIFQNLVFKVLVILKAQWSILQ